jgi:WD40 repeat protein
MVSEEFDDGVELLVKKSEGMFLYFHYAAEEILEHSSLTLTELQSLLPDGIDDYYELNFRRIYEKLGKSKYFTLLQAVIAARTDFPQSLIGPLLKTDESETAQVVSIISDILPIQERHVHVFHKSVRDWVTNVELAEDLLVKPSLGHNDVARLCYQKFQDIKSTSHSPSELFLDPSSRYVIDNIIYHFCNASDDDLEEDFRSILLDLRYMYCRLQLSQESARDLLDDYEEARKVSDQLSSLIDTCFAFVRRNAEHLASMPHLVYQCSLNEPEAVANELQVQSYSSNLLSSFPELTLYFELINKPRTIAPTLTKCTCDDQISALELVPNSQNVVCSDANGNIYIWNKHSAELMHKEEAEGYSVFRPINECSTTPDGRCICYGNLSHALTPEGNTITLISNAKTSANTCCFSPCGKYILAWSYYGEGIFRLFNKLGVKNFQSDYVVELWKIDNETCTMLEHHKDKEVRPISACFSNDSSLVVCGHKDGRITIWESKTGTQKAILYTDGTVVKQASNSSKPLQKTPNPSNDPIYAMSYSPNGHYLAVCYSKGVLLWDAPALSLILNLPCPSTETQNVTCTTCCFSPNNDKLAAGFSNGYIHAWELHAATENPYPLKIASQPSGSSDSIIKCAFDDDLNIVCAIRNSVCVYSFDSLQSSSILSQAITARHPKKATYSINIPNSGLALTSGNSTICKWEMHTGKLLDITNDLPGSSHLVIMSEDVLIVFGEPYNIHILEKDTLKFRQTICHCNYNGDYENDVDAPAGITHCAISNNGIIAYGTGDGLLYIRYGSNYVSTKTLYAHEEGCVTYIQFFPHGQAFISADDDGNVIKWEITNGKESKLEVKEVRMAGHEDSVEQILFSQLGIYPQRVVTCSSDKSVNLYDSLSCDLIKKLEGHGSDVLKIALSGDGKLIASGDSQGCVILWDSFTGCLLRRMSYKATKTILDLYFIQNDKYVCARGSNMNALTAYSVNKGNAVSVLSFTSSITTSSVSSIGHTHDAHALDNDIVLCGLADGTVNFVKVCEVQEGSIAEKVASKKKTAENKEANTGKRNFHIVLSFNALRKGIIQW